MDELRLSVYPDAEWRSCWQRRFLRGAERIWIVDWAVVSRFRALRVSSRSNRPSSTLERGLIPFGVQAAGYWGRDGALVGQRSQSGLARRCVFVGDRSYCHLGATPLSLGLFGRSLGQSSISSVQLSCASATQLHRWCIPMLLSSALISSFVGSLPRSALNDTSHALT